MSGCFSVKTGYSLEYNKVFYHKCSQKHVLGEQLGYSLTVRIFYPYVVCTVPCFFV